MSSAIRSSPRPCSTVCSTTPSSSRLKAQAIACASTPPSCRKTARPGPRHPSKPTCHVVADDHRKTEAPIHNPADHRSLHLGNFRPPEMGKIRSPLTWHTHPLAGQPPRRSRRGQTPPPRLPASAPHSSADAAPDRSEHEPASPGNSSHRCKRWCLHWCQGWQHHSPDGKAAVTGRIRGRRHAPACWGLRWTAYPVLTRAWRRRGEADTKNPLKQLSFKGL